MRDRPLLELIIVSKSFSGLALLAEQITGICLEEISSNKKVLKLTGPALSGAKFGKKSLNYLDLWHFSPPYFSFSGILFSMHLQLSKVNLDARLKGVLGSDLQGALKGTNLRGQTEPFLQMLFSNF